jgi:general secretion pathway protein G
MPRLFGQGEKAKVQATRVQLRVLEDALSQFEVDNGAYPTTDQGLQALVKAPPDAKHYREGGYLEKGQVPKDPWGNPYVYFAPGRHGEDYEVISYGADGSEGGEGKYKDISSTDTEENKK